MTSIGSLRFGISAILARRAETRFSNVAEQISSGDRISRASIDPAGLAVSLDLSHKARLRESALLNINHGVSVSQLANGVLSTVSEVTGRLEELAAQASNGTLSDLQRGILNQEYQALRQELDRINQTTQYNGQKIFGNSLGIQSGIAGNSSEISYLSLSSIDSKSLGITGDISTQQNAQSQLDAVLNAQQNLSNAQSSNGAFSAKLEVALQNNATLGLGESTAAGRIADLDMAEASASNIASNISSQISVALQAHSSANFDQVNLLV